jgi:hypothetical protein
MATLIKDQLKGKEPLYRDFYNGKISEEELIRQISIIDNNAFKRNKVVSFIKDILLPTWRARWL